HRSHKHIRSDDITVANDEASGVVTIDADDIDDFSFVIAHTVAPTELLIESLAGGDIILDGLIDNPVGTTTLRSVGGVLEDSGGRIRTNRAHLEAERIGHGGDPINVDLVRSSGRTTDLDATAAGD